MMHTGTQSLCDLYTFERLRGSGSIPTLRICGPKTEVAPLLFMFWPVKWLQWLETGL